MRGTENAISQPPTLPAKGGLIWLINQLPKIAQGWMLGIASLQRSQTYITDMPGQLPMLRDGVLSVEMVENLRAHEIWGAQSQIIDMDGVKLHALYLPPKNGKIVCAFHGIKGNWLNNPTPENADPRDTDDNPNYRMVLLEELAKKDFGFLAFSMPGFEPSQGSASEVNFIAACDAFATHTVILARKSGITAKDIIVCGESMGGAYATIFAAKLTARNLPPSALSLIAAFDSIIEMTRNEFPIFTNEELRGILTEQLDITQMLKQLDRRQTSLHIVSVEDDRIIPHHNTANLLSAAHIQGFHIVYQRLTGNHTTWHTPTVVHGITLTSMAEHIRAEHQSAPRDAAIAVAEHHTVEYIESRLAELEAQKKTSELVGAVKENVAPSAASAAKTSPCSPTKSPCPPSGIRSRL